MEEQLLRIEQKIDGLATTIEKKIDSLAVTIQIMDEKLTHLSSDVNDLTEIVVSMKGYMEDMDSRMATKEDILKV